MKLYWLAMICYVASLARGQHLSISVLQQDKPTSIRGLSVLDDSVAWVSGSNGWVGRTTDRGRTWDWQQVAGHETMDFRDIEAFSANEALIISAGSPLVILRTVDSGDTWQEAHRNERSDIFFDGMDFWDDGRGIAYGDPIGGTMQLLSTDDNGRSWTDISAAAGIQLIEGEAGFAASGTGIRTLPGGHVFIATGGRQSRLFHSTDYGRTWTGSPCPIMQGTSSTGVFSIAFRDGRHGVAVGGDYLRDQIRDEVVLLTADGGVTWETPPRGTNGYRSAVEYINPDTLVASGTSGVDVSFDGGLHWDALSEASFHTVQKAKNGSWVVLAGADGRIASLH